MSKCIDIITAYNAQLATKADMLEYASCVRYLYEPIQMPSPVLYALKGVIIFILLCGIYGATQWDKRKLGVYVDFSDRLAGYLVWSVTGFLISLGCFLIYLAISFIIYGG